MHDWLLPPVLLLPLVPHIVHHASILGLSVIDITLVYQSNGNQSAGSEPRMGDPLTISLAILAAADPIARIAKIADLFRSAMRENPAFYE